MTLITRATNEWTFTSVKKREAKDYIGFEIELDGRNPRISRSALTIYLEQLAAAHNVRVVVEHDASLINGMELVVNPMTYGAIDELSPFFIKLFRDMTNNGFINDTNTAGGHIHFSAKAFGNTLETRNYNIRRVIKWFYKNKEDLMKYALRREGRVSFQFYDDFTSDKFSAVNTRHRNAADAIETVEFRIFKGLTDMTTLRANVELLKLIVSTVRDRSKDLEAMSLNDLVTASKRSHKNAYAHWLSVK